GPGIPKSEIPRVLQAFGQGSLAQDTSEGGTGLGLPIVQSLVSLHGGRFRLRSELRKGTEAIVWLPPGRLMSSRPRGLPQGDGLSGAHGAGGSETEAWWRMRGGAAPQQATTGC